MFVQSFERCTISVSGIDPSRIKPNCKLQQRIETEGRIVKDGDGKIKRGKQRGERVESESGWDKDCFYDPADC